MLGSLVLGKDTIKEGCVGLSCARGFTDASKHLLATALGQQSTSTGMAFGFFVLAMVEVRVVRNPVPAQCCS